MAKHAFQAGTRTARKRLLAAFAAFEYCGGTGFFGIGFVRHADAPQKAMRLTGASNASLRAAYHQALLSAWE